MAEKAIRVSLKRLPSKSFRIIMVYKTNYRLKSLFHLVPAPFWEWLPGTSRGILCWMLRQWWASSLGTSLYIPHLLEITFCHESLFVLLIISDPLLFNSSSEISILQETDREGASKKSKCLQNSGFSLDFRLTDVSFTGYKYSSKNGFAFLVTSHWPSQCR